MRKLLLILFTINCFAQSPPVEWEYKSVGTDNVIYSIAPTSDGGVIASGTVRPLPYPSFNVNLKLIKFNAAGTIEWQHDYPQTIYYSGMKIIQTADGGYAVIGVTTVWSGTWFAKLDAQGNILWEIALNGTAENCAELFDVAATPDGGFILTGMFCSNVIATKVSASGQVVWHAEYAPQTWFWRPEKVKVLMDGSFVIYGRPYTESGGNLDLYLWKFDANGNYINHVVFGGTDSDFPADIEITSDGGYIIVGTVGYPEFYGATSHGAGDIFAMKLANDFTVEWTKLFGGSGSEIAHAISNTNDGGYIITGESDSNDGDVIGNFPFYTHSWTFKTDSLGNLEWQKPMGNHGRISYDIAQANDGGYYIAGQNETAANKELYVAKLSATLPVNEFKAPKLFISPNPARESISISFEDTYKINQIVISDISGKTLIHKVSNEINLVDVSNLAAGIYFIKAYSREKVFKSKFVKE